VTVEELERELSYAVHDADVIIRDGWSERTVRRVRVEHDRIVIET